MINRNIQFFLKLVRCAMYADYSTFSGENKEDEWKAAFQMAITNQMQALLGYYVNGLAERNIVSGQTASVWKQTSFTCMMREGTKYVWLRRILAEAEKQDVLCVLFKGCILADLYPQYLMRSSCDTDIFVHRKDGVAIEKILLNLGFIKWVEKSKENVPVYVLPKEKYMIEIHFSLWEDHEGPQILLLDAMNLTAEESLLHTKACGMDVVTLGYEQHLIFQIFHIVKHFSLEGINLRYLVDITYFINAYAEKIDWKDFWSKMDILHYAHFCRLVFNLCIHFLGMTSQIADLKIVNIDEAEDLLLDLVHNGSCSTEKNAGWQLLGIMTPYFTGIHTIPQSRFRRKLRVLFPSSKGLPPEYSYAEKYPVLLPIAWIHRFVLFLFKWGRNRNMYYGASQKLTIAEHRLALMRELELIEGKQTS